VRTSPNAAVVVAGGRGERLGDPAKCLLSLAGRPMLAWSLDALEQAASVEHVVVVAGAHTRAAVEALVGGGAWPKVVAVVEGGERRQDSVAAGLAAVPAAAAVLVHDAARPLAEPALFDRCAAATLATGAAVAAIPVADTLKRVADDRVTATVDRAGLWAAQTPQGFRQEVVERLLPLMHGAETVTDEARLCESLGLPIAVVPGSPANLKVTLPDDVAVAAALLRARTAEAPPRMTRSGIGYDVHRLVPGRRLVLGGVEIAHERGLEGHSDADVLLHAIADALLGAAALGDIGRYFPPSDPQYAGADSRDLLRHVAALLAAAGYRPVNVDATVIAEAPRLGPHVPAMRRAIAACLDLTSDAVGVKATTNEGLGFAGREEGIAAVAVAVVAPNR
jgi:2-C-methyl-D-erythritol 4-phosphate cytidylyltransferase / 2-C-methyl-D-erythritol 2,4-cyclodiphosphate synthase